MLIDSLRMLARRWLTLAAEIRELDDALERLVRHQASALMAAPGIAVGTIAEMLIVLGDNPERIRSEAAFAKLCGVCPIPASSGKTTRHRLNRGGNRRANAALHRVAVVRMRSHPETKAYVHRRTAEGKSLREIRRCLTETVIGLFKTEVIRRRGPWRSLEAVEYATLEWVAWFNNHRLPEPIGNIPPAEAEARYYAAGKAPALAA
ncbi:MAG: transposase [Acetobacteraceae bacterium]|nr:transposase [Acetobacteraceae bacterium]